MLRSWKFEVQLDKKSDKAVYLQIADAMIKDIQSGRLKAGEALPGGRNLAQLLKVNRNTVVEALNVLIIEGWLVSKERQGTFVAKNIPKLTSTIKSRQPTSMTMGQLEKPFHIQFDDGHPNAKIAPVTELARAYRQIFSFKTKWQLMNYDGNALGDIAFRQEIAQMLNHQRGMQVHEDNLCMTRGSQMAMYLTAQCLLEIGDEVMVENPGYQPAWKAFEHAGANLLPVGVDEEGLVIDEVVQYLKSNKRIKAIYVTPHHQYPTTVTLSLKRRLELIRLSNEYGFAIIEDDYDNEFHFGYRPVLPLSSYPELKNYVYIGTLSKVVSPVLRVGYLASNDSCLIEKVGQLRKIIDVNGDSIMEQAVLQLIKDGAIKRHIKKVTSYYKTKRDFTAGLLKKHLKDKVNYNIPDGGLAFWLAIKVPTDWVSLSQKMLQKGVKITSLYTLDGNTNGLRLGYGVLTEEELEEGIVALSCCL
ncbi:PLP-dependent aminotransferase family protein [Pedobacter sp.]|uniref:MocR-like pyridoxine biosynthesis transcription factor PdxR n=1 Tax=Pedobacter sp. TaxID=1411316 RepID=UPI0031D0D4BF